MPYFLFEIPTEGAPSRVGHFESYRDARQAARERRRALPADSGLQVRMVFAADERQAQALLREKREPRPLGEDA